MTDDAFHIVRSHLASFGIGPYLQNKKLVEGFLTRMDHQLYVEKANADTGSKQGDQILSLDGSDLDQVASLHKDYFISKHSRKTLPRISGFGLSQEGSLFSGKG